MEVQKSPERVPMLDLSPGDEFLWPEPGCDEPNTLWFIGIMGEPAEWFAVNPSTGKIVKRDSAAQVIPVKAVVQYVVPMEDCQ